MGIKQSPLAFRGKGKANGDNNKKKSRNVLITFQRRM